MCTAQECEKRGTWAALLPWMNNNLAGAATGVLYHIDVRVLCVGQRIDVADDGPKLSRL